MNQNNTKRMGLPKFQLIGILTALCFVGTQPLFPGSPQVLNHSPASQNYYQQQQIQQNQRQQNVYQQSALSSYYGAQQASHGDSINKLSAYFGPKGVNVYDNYQLPRAVQIDQSQRMEAAQRLTGNVDSQLNSLGTQYRQTVENIVDSNGGLKTYNQRTIRDASEGIQKINADAQNLSRYLSGDFKTQYNATVNAPYLDRSTLIDNSARTDKIAGYYLNGDGGDFKGIQGMQQSMNISARQFSDSAIHIDSAERDAKDHFVENTVMGGLQTAIGAVLTFTPAAPGGGLMMASGITQMGSGIRNQIVLENRGLEGFRSDAETKAGLGVQYFQMSLAAAQVVNGIEQLSTRVSQAASQDADGNVLHGFAALSTPEKFYVGYQYSASGYQLADLSGVTNKVMNEKDKLYVGAGMAAANLAFLASGVDSSLNMKTDPTLNKMAMDPRTAESAKILSTERPLTVANQAVSNSLQIAEVNPQVREFAKNNSLAIGAVSNGVTLIDLKTRDGYQNEKLQKARETISDASGIFREQMEKQSLVLQEKVDANAKTMEEFQGVFPRMESKVLSQLKAEKGEAEGKKIYSEITHPIPDFGEVSRSIERSHMEARYPSIVKGKEIVSFNLDDPKFQAKNAQIAEMKSLLYAFHPVEEPLQKPSSIQPESIEKTVLVSGNNEGNLKRYYQLAKSGASVDTLRSNGATLTVADRSEAGKIQIYMSSHEGQTFTHTINYDPAKQSWSTGLDRLSIPSMNSFPAQQNGVIGR